MSNGDEDELPTRSIWTRVNGPRKSTCHPDSWRLSASVTRIVPMQPYFGTLGLCMLICPAGLRPRESGEASEEVRSWSAHLRLLSVRDQFCYNLAVAGDVGGAQYVPRSRSAPILGRHPFRFGAEPLPLGNPPPDRGTGQVRGLRSSERPGIRHLPVCGMRDLCHALSAGQAEAG